MKQHIYNVEKCLSSECVQEENINEFQDTVGYFVHLFDALYSPYFMYDETLSNEYFNNLVIWLNGIWKIQQHMPFPTDSKSEPCHQHIYPVMWLVMKLLEYCCFKSK